MTERQEPGRAGADAPRPSAAPGPSAHVPGPPADGRALRLVREHPWITAIMLACTVGGALAGPALFDDDWSLLRQLAAGAFCGAWVGITLTVTKMIGD